jgi:rsbT co-antagonist protein RsbR
MSGGGSETTVAVERLERIAEVLTLLSLGEGDGEQLSIGVKESDELSVVETAINIFVRDYRGLKRENRQRGEVQEELAATIEEQQTEIERLSTPIIEIDQNIVAVPIIGRLHAARCERIIELVLTWVTRHHTRHVILDLTGVTLSDAESALQLLKIAEAVRLVGSELALSGTHPSIALELAGAAGDLRTVRCCRTIREALAYFRRAADKRPSPRGSRRGSRNPSIA